MRKRILIIHNPISGTPAGRRLLDRVCAHLSKMGCTLQIHVTSEPGDAETRARSLRPGDVDIVAVAGGDGTVNEVVNGLADAGGGRIAVAHNFSIAFARPGHAVVLNPDGRVQGYGFHPGLEPLAVEEPDRETLADAIAQTQTAHRMFYAGQYHVSRRHASALPAQ